MRFENRENDMDGLFEDGIQVDSEYVTEQSMNALYEMGIEPMESKLSKEDLALVSLIGVTLKLVAHKAKLYEDMQDGNLGENFLN